MATDIPSAGISSAAQGAAGPRQAVDAHALQGLLARSDPLRILDVRTPAEFETAHIPGAYNVPLGTLTEHRREIAAHLDERVVLVCQGGQRSERAERALADAGLPNLRILHGGMQAWQAAGGAVTRGRERWALERQVRLVAGSIVFGSVLASTVLPRAKWIAAGIGGGLAFAALSNTCAMGAVLMKLPYNRGPETDPREVIGRLAESARRTAA